MWHKLVIVANGKYGETKKKLEKDFFMAFFDKPQPHLAKMYYKDKYTSQVDMSDNLIVYFNSECTFYPETSKIVKDYKAEPCDTPLMEDIHPFIFIDE